MPKTFVVKDHTLMFPCLELCCSIRIVITCLSILLAIALANLAQCQPIGLDLLYHALYPYLNPKWFSPNHII